MMFTDFVLRILVALGLGFCIGLERDLTGHLAGIRINVLMCLGSCLFLLFPMLYGSNEMFRIASYIVSGVGFLCSGVIFKDSVSVRGINTAATLWCTAAIGILASSGMFLFASVATAILIISNVVLRLIVRRIRPLADSDEMERKYRISVTCQEAAELAIRSLLLQQKTCRDLYLVDLESSDINGEKVEIYAEYIGTGKLKGRILEQIVRDSLEQPAVIKAGWEVLE